FRPSKAPRHLHALIKVAALSDNETRRRKGMASVNSCAMKCVVAFFACSILLGCSASRSATGSPDSSPDKTVSVFSDYQSQKPGASHKLPAADSPPPFATQSADNGPSLTAKPDDAWPQAPAGFKVQLYAKDLNNPRLIRTAPNGDLFVAESGPSQVKVFRG